MKGNDPRRKKKIEKQPNRLWTADGEGFWHSEKQGGSLFGRSYHGAQVAQVPPHRQKTSFKF